MGIFGNQIETLVAQVFHKPKQLAQEIYRILSNGEPLRIDGPIHQVTNSSGPAYSVSLGSDDNQNLFLLGESGGSQQVGNGSTIFRFTRGNIETNIDLDPDGDLAITKRDKSTPSVAGAASAGTSTGGGGTPCKVVSGSGSTYTVTLYPDGSTGEAGSNVTATQMQIASGETIPAGSWGFVTKLGSSYFMQFAVWL